MTIRPREGARKNRGKRGQKAQTQKIKEKHCCNAGRRKTVPGSEKGTSFTGSCDGEQILPITKRSRSISKMEKKSESLRELMQKEKLKHPREVTRNVTRRKKSATVLIKKSWGGSG